jgi:hypothetical protein
VLLPAQIEELATLAVTVGGAPTTTVTVAVPVHVPDVPVTVYVVVVAGVLVITAPFTLPGIQL